MEEDGTHIHDKDRIVKRCVEFCEELYRSRRASADQNSHDDPTTISTIDPPSVLPSEVEASIKRLKRNQAQGEDNITGGILQDGGDAMIQILTDLFNTFLVANSTSKLQEVLQDIYDISKPKGLKMHLVKTKVMCNKYVNKGDVIVMERRTRKSILYLRHMVTKES